MGGIPVARSAQQANASANTPAAIEEGRRHDELKPRVRDHLHSEGPGYRFSDPARDAEARQAGALGRGDHHHPGRIRGIQRENGRDMAELTPEGRQQAVSRLEAIKQELMGMSAWVDGNEPQRQNASILLEDVAKLIMVACYQVERIDPVQLHPLLHRRGLHGS